MFSIRAKSTFNFLFRGLLVLLVVTSVEALPTKHKSTTAPSCPLRAPKSRLHKRAPLVHPSATQAITLFHGTITAAAAESVQSKIVLAPPITNDCGDFHHNRDRKSEGGFYLTDSVIAAAQYACYSKTFDPAFQVPDMVHVLEFAWKPEGRTVYEFHDLKSSNDNQCRTHDMITGPMHDDILDKNLTPSFWQYAIVKQTAATEGLGYHHTYEIHCKNVPMEKKLTDDLYEQGQAGNPHFQELITHLTSASC